MISTLRAEAVTSTGSAKGDTWSSTVRMRMILIAKKNLVLAQKKMTARNLIQAQKTSKTSASLVTMTTIMRRKSLSITINKGMWQLLCPWNTISCNTTRYMHSLYTVMPKNNLQPSRRSKRRQLLQSKRNNIRDKTVWISRMPHAADAIAGITSMKTVEQNRLRPLAPRLKTLSQLTLMQLQPHQP